MYIRYKSSIGVIQESCVVSYVWTKIFLSSFDENIRTKFWRDCIGNNDTTLFTVEIPFQNILFFEKPEEMHLKARFSSWFEQSVKHKKELPLRTCNTNNYGQFVV